MKINIKQYYLVCIVCVLAACVKPFEPDVIKASNNFLVVEGIINCAPNSATSILLTRTRKLSDTVSAIPELKAQVSIEGQAGDRYVLPEKGSGVYTSASLNLNANGKYRLKIVTTDGNEFASDLVTVKLTPAVDTLIWKQQGNEVTIYLNSHDPQNNTRYYRWEYAETWQYRSFYDSHLQYLNGQVIFRDTNNLLTTCWISNSSTDILLHSTEQLSQDIIQLAPVTAFPAQSPRLELEYSINVKQYALTKAAYEYWQILQKNTQQLGGLFDTQPSQLVSNIHNTNKPDEPVFGYVSAASAEEKRIFIKRGEIDNGYNPISNCTATIIPLDSAQYYLSNPFLAPAYSVGNGGYIAISDVKCVDCRLRGGTTTRPPFWQ